MGVITYQYPNFDADLYYHFCGRQGTIKITYTFANNQWPL